MRSPRIGLAFVLLSAGLTVAFYFFAVSELQQTRNGALRQLEANATRDADVLAQWRAERLADGKTFSAGLPSRLARWRAQNFMVAPVAAEIKARLRITLEAYNYSGARLFDVNEQVILSQVAAGVPLEALDQLDNRKLEGERPVLSPLHINDGRKASIALDIPLWYQGQREGRLSFLIEPQPLMIWLFGPDSTTSPDTHAVLLQDIDDRLLWFAPEPAWPDRTHPIEWRMREAPAVVSDALKVWRERPDESLEIFVDDRGVSRFVRFIAVPGSPWVVMSTTKRMAVCGPCIKRQVTIGLALIVFLVLSAAALISWKRAQQEHEVARRNAVLSAAAAAMPGALYVAEADSFKTLFISKGIRYLLGCESDDILSLPGFFVDFLHSEDREATISAFNTLVASRHTVSVLNYRAWMCDRSHWVWIEDRVFVERNERGKARLLYGVMFDITERKLAEQDLRDTNRALESLNADLQTANERANELAGEASAASHAKSEFLANMSHEIRTPLTAIIGITDLLAESRLDDEQLQYVETLRGASRSLLALINDILDFSKIEKGRLTLEQITFALDPVIDEVVTVAAVQAEAKGLELILDVEHGVPAWLFGDSLRLRQVLINLLNNAVKFTSSGDVILSVRRIEAEANTTKAEVVEFSVQDTGIGIAPERQAALFEAFTQADSSTTRRFGGTGLGLSIASSLVTLMGASLRAESDLGVGSRFFFTLRFDRPVPAESASLPPDALRGKRALIVAAHRTLRESLCRHLTALGLQVQATGDGVNAVSQMSEAPADLVVMDYRLPNTNTEDLMQTLGNNAATRPGFIVMVPGGLYGEAARLRASGLADAVLSKPVRRDKLGQALSDALQQRFPADAANSGSPQAEAGIGTVIGDAKSASADRVQGACILVADDEPTNQIVLRKVLEKLGHRVVIAANGREAIEKLAQQPCDLVLMDIRMPEMNGHQATRAIRAQDSTALNPKVPIIALTAEAVAGERDAALAAGMDDFLTKPIEIAALGETIKRWLVSTD